MTDELINISPEEVAEALLWHKMQGGYKATVITMRLRGEDIGEFVQILRQATDAKMILATLCAYLYVEKDSDD